MTLRFPLVLSLGLVLLLGSACNQQPMEADLPQTENASFTELASGFSYLDYGEGVSIEQNFFDFDSSTVPAIQSKVNSLQGQVKNASDRFKLEAWERALTEAKEAYNVLQSSEAQLVVSSYKNQLTAQGVLPKCTNAATARGFATGSGAKADASATCSGGGITRWETEAKANARAGGRLDRDSDDGGSFSRASASQAGARPCGSDAYAKSIIDPQVGPDIPFGSKSDTNSGC